MLWKEKDSWFASCMEHIQGKEAKEKVVATDRHVNIKSDMKRNSLM